MPSIDLTPISIPEPTALDEVRTSKMKSFGTVLSGIDKQQRQGKLFVAKLGLPEDEHDLTFHGGVDKAVHQYCTDHYAYWQSAYPKEATSGCFKPGGFGENLVAKGFNEENICIGDLVSISHTDQVADDGKACILEVSLPRQPCFKLNQRFGIKNFAPETHRASKTGWYYRVKQEGFVEPGMEIRVIHRSHPRWSIARLLHYVHRDQTDMDIVRELQAIDVMGNECRKVFDKRWEQHELSKQPRPVEKWRPFLVIRKTHETSRIVAIELQAESPLREDVKAPVNSYASIRLPNGLTRTYSIVEGTPDRFVLGVAQDDNSRGGSTYIHDELQTGHIVHIGEIKRSMVPSGMASHVICLVGGIGITAFLAMMKKLKDINQTFELHYAVRAEEEIAFRHLLSDLGEPIHTYSKDDGQRMDIEKILRSRPWNTHVFTCGPQRMIDAVVTASAALGMAEDEVLFEKFTTDASGDPFSAEIVSTERSVRVEVESSKTLLQVMKEAGFDVPSSCEVGNCGTCKIRVKKGRVEHRGTGLTEAEKNDEMLSCVSRGIGHIVVEDPTCAEV